MPEALELNRDGRAGFLKLRPSTIRQDSDNNYQAGKRNIKNRDEDTHACVVPITSQLQKEKQSPKEKPRASTRLAKKRPPGADAMTATEHSEHQRT